MSAFAENRDQEIQARIQAYLILLKWAEEQRQKRLAVCATALDEYLDVAASATDPTEMLRAYLIEQGRTRSDIANLVSKSEALRVQLSQDSKIAHTQREISELMFHLQDFDSQFQSYTPRSPPDSHFAPDAITAKRERAFVEFRVFSSKRPCDESFSGAHYVTVQILRTCNMFHEDDCTQEPLPTCGASQVEAPSTNICEKHVSCD